MKISHSAWLRGVLFGLMGLLAVPSMTAASRATTVDGINYLYDTKTKTATVEMYDIVNRRDENGNLVKDENGKNIKDSIFYEGNIVIPPSIEVSGVTYPVVGTEPSAFQNCRDLISVSLPESCVEIGNNTFNGCSSLAAWPVPATATKIGQGSFVRCLSLTEAVIPSGVTGKLITGMFAGCENLKKITFEAAETDTQLQLNYFVFDAPNTAGYPPLEEVYIYRQLTAPTASNLNPFHNVKTLKKLVLGGEMTSMNSTMFQGCTALEDVQFADGNKIAAIGSSAFASCTALQSIALPVAVTTIEASTFNGATSLENITMGDVTSIGVTAFYNSGIKSLANFPATIQTISQQAFQNSKIEGDVVLPASLTSLGSQAFAGTRATSFALPAGLASIGNAAFAPIETLAGLTAEGNEAFKVEDGVLYNAAGTRLLVSAHESEIGTELTNEEVESVDNYGLAFSPFETVNLPNVTTLGNYAFYKAAVKAFEIKAATTLGQNLFNGSALESLVIENGRNEIPQGLAANCEHLTSVTLPETATSLMRDCFANCPALEEMELPQNVSYMEPGSVPATIKTLRVLNPNVPALADGVFTADQSEVTCLVAPAAVNKFKAADQWKYLNIQADPTISGVSAEFGCPTGLYFTTTDGKLYYKNEDGEIIDTQFAAGAHAFTLASYKNRIYVADAGVNFTYQDPNQPLGDGQLFYVNRTGDIYYRVTVLNNVGGAPSEDPFTMSIDESENKIYIADRNVGVHELSADAAGLYGQQPFLFQNQWLPFYNDYISWGSITGGFTRDSHGIFWMTKKYNGLGVLRFTRNDIYPDGNIAGKPVPYKKLFADVIIKTAYLDEANGYYYMHVLKDPYGCVPGIYRIALNRLCDPETGADVEGNTDLKIADCQLIDDSPILSNRTQEASGEIANVAQITGDGENVYWGYIAATSDENSISGSVPLDAENPLHKSGIKAIKSADENPVVTFAVENVEAYGVTGATYVAPPVVAPTSITLNKTEVEFTELDQQEQLIATILPEDATDQSVTWASDNEAFVTVGETGLLTVVAVPEADEEDAVANITATSNGNPELIATCVVTVKKQEPVVILPESISLNLDEITFTDMGQQEQLIATVLPEEATDRSVTWASDNEAFVTVDEEGVLTVVAVPEFDAVDAVANITATSNANPKLIATCVVTVKKQEPVVILPTSITLNMDEIEFSEVGEQVQLIATIEPENATERDLIWETSDETVAAVDEDGWVTAGEGAFLPQGGPRRVHSPNAQVEAVITVRSASAPDVFATCDIYVSRPTGIVDVNAGKAVESVKYYNAAGFESNAPFQGVNIVVKHFKDGSTQVEKVVK
ncbi:MAG: leucine-rich repeat protein [Muribaculaceae bacterium]|nr:leucine-rich repeat protein [Muribaculaceae bacterium]